MRRRSLLVMHMDGETAELDCDVVTDRGESLVASVYEAGVKASDTLYPLVNVRSVVIRYHHDAQPGQPGAVDDTGIRRMPAVPQRGATDDTIVVSREG